MGPLVWKALGGIAAIVAATLADKLTNKALTTAGKDTSIDPEDPDVPLKEALLFAAVTALVASVVRTLTQRKAAEVYARNAGHLPKAIVDQREQRRAEAHQA